MSTSTKTSLGRRIRTLRVRHSLTQERLALMVGVEQSYVSRLEAGERNPSIDLLAKFAEAFEISLSELFYGVG